MSSSFLADKHQRTLNKIAAALPQAREFLLSYDGSKNAKDNVRAGMQQRWYGNVSEMRVTELNRLFRCRFFLSKFHLNSLKVFTSDKLPPDDFCILNHFYMFVTDPYYRWATGTFFPDRVSRGHLELPRALVQRELAKQMPENMSSTTHNRYTRNLLTAARDNGIVKGNVNKSIGSPLINSLLLGWMIYVLQEFGPGTSYFNNSPLEKSFHKDKEQLVTLFLDGQKKGYWEFTGDRSNFSVSLRFGSVLEWVEKGI